MADSPTWGTLLNLAAGPPSAEAWATLTDGYEALADAHGADASALAALRSALAAWPDDLRVFDADRIRRAARTPKDCLGALLRLSRALPPLGEDLLESLSTVMRRESFGLGHEAFLASSVDPATGRRRPGAATEPWARFAHVVAFDEGNGDGGPGWITPLLYALDFARVRSLHVHEAFARDVLGVLVKERLARTVEHLRLSMQHHELWCVTWGGAFDRRRRLRALRTLELEGYALWPRGVLGLTKSELPCLKTLVLPLMEGGGLRALAGAPWLAGLRVLELRLFYRLDHLGPKVYLDHRLEHDGVIRRAHLDAPRDPLEGGASIVDRDVAALAAGAALTGLRVLRLATDSLTRAGVLSLCRAPWIAGLRALHIRSAHPAFLPSEAEALLRAACPGLRDLSVQAGGELPRGWREAAAASDVPRESLPPDARATLVRFGADL